MDTLTSELVVNVAAALSGVVVGAMMSMSSDYYKRKREIRNAGENFVTQLEVFLEHTPKQVEMIREYIENLKSTEIKPFTLQMSRYLKIQKQQSLNIILVQKYIKGKLSKKENAKHVLNLFNATIEVIGITYDNLSTELDCFISKMEDIRSKLSDNTDEIISQMSIWIEENKLNKQDFEKDTFLSYLENDIAEKMLKSNEVHPIALNDYYVIELMEKCAESINHPLAKLIYPYVRSNFRVCNTFKFVIKNTAFNLEAFAKYMEREVNELNELSQKYRLN